LWFERAVLLGNQVMDLWNPRYSG